MVLSLTEHQEIQHAAQRVSEQVGGTVRLMVLLRDWSRFTRLCERGFNRSADEYLEGLSTRELLQEILENVSERVAEKLRPAVRQLDERFEAATQATSQRLYIVSDPPTPLELMLYFRLPRKRGAWLDLDLRRMGVIE